MKVARRALESRRDDPVDPLVIYCHLSGALNRIEALEAVVEAARSFVKEQDDQPQNTFHGSKRVRITVSALVKALAKLDGREGEG